LEVGEWAPRMDMVTSTYSRDPDTTKSLRFGNEEMTRSFVSWSLTCMVLHTGSW
jgi:hypothetical protein